MSTPWETESDTEVPDTEVMLQRDVAASLTERQLDTLGKQKVKESYQTKASLVLIDSDKHDWGVVEDTLSDLLWEPGKGEVVGTWSKPRYDNLIHISLGTAISVLQDRSVQTFARYAEERRQKELGTKKPARKGKGAAEPMPEPVQELSVDEKLKFNSLRAQLGRAK